jgi:hypothetical protein
MQNSLHQLIATIISERVIERLLFNTKWAIFQLYHGENKLHFNELMKAVLHYSNTLGWIFIVLAHWNNNFQLYFCYIMAVSLIGRGNKITCRKPLTKQKSLKNLIKSISIPEWNWQLWWWLALIAYVDVNQLPYNHSHYAPQ